MYASFRFDSMSGFEQLAVESRSSCNNVQRSCTCISRTVHIHDIGKVFSDMWRLSNIIMFCLILHLKASVVILD